MTGKAKYPCDMHTHSNRSDGNDSPQALIDLAVERGLRVLVLSDHDVRPPKQIEIDGRTIDPVEYAASRGLIFIPGIEFSCDTENDDVHIVGIGCDFDSPAMQEAERFAENSKVNGYRRLTEILCEHDIKVTWQDILDNHGQPRRPEEVQRKHVFEAIAAAGYTKTWAEAKLMVRDNPVFNVKREKIDPRRAIEMIRQSGGLAILAHPYLIDEETNVDGAAMPRAAYIDRLIEAGLSGIEACYTYPKTSYKGTMTPGEIEQEIRQRYESRVAIISGGSDYHHDGLKGVANQRELGEAGITWDYFRANSLLQRFIPAG
ncbi:MAG: PHP domain-containing protein [Eubacteriales bacterium]|nr:PHP domain-containing protein [Eubacteriales bacterium]